MTLPESITALTLSPGDRVLLGFTHQVSRELAGAMQAQLAERFPGVEFTRVSGAQIAVQKGATP